MYSRKISTSSRKRKRQHMLMQRIYVQNLPDFDNESFPSSSSGTSDEDISTLGDELSETNESASDSESDSDSLLQSSSPTPIKNEFLEAVLLAILSHARCNLTSTEIITNLFNCAMQRFSSADICFPSVRHYWEKKSRNIGIEVYILCEKNHSHGPYIGDPKNYQPYECEGDIIPCLLSSGDNYFIHIPLRKQLEKYLPSIPSCFWQTNGENNQIVEDVSNSLLAREVKENGTDSIQRLTLTLHADEVSCSKSSPIKIFPVFVSLNDLKPFNRRKFFFMVGLYVGKEKPSVEKFLGPIVEEIDSLSKEPIDFNLGGLNGDKVTFHLISIIADAPMRAYLRNVKQYNHLNGCDWCLIEATSANGARVYSNVTQEELLQLKREKTDFLSFRDWQENFPFSNEFNPRFKGINGVSPLLALNDFDIVRGTAVEPMHSISLGVFRRLIMNGILAANIGNIFERNVNKTFFIKEMSQRLIAIKVPSEFPRIPRHIDQIKYWKSCEFDSFLAYYFLATAKGLIKPTIIRHVATLARLFYLAHKGPVQPSIIKEIRNLVEEFQKSTAVLFGSSFLSYNLHILSHLADSLMYLGPNANVSSYPLEDHMGKLKIKVRRYSAAGKALIRVFMNDFRYAEYVETKIKKWHLNDKEKKFFGIFGDEAVITTIEDKSISDRKKIVTLELIKNRCSLNNITIKDLNFFKTVRFNGIRYSILAYCEKKQRNDSYVQAGNKYYEIDAIVKLRSKFIFLCRPISIKVQNFSYKGFTGYFSYNLDHILEVTEIKNTLETVEIESVSNKCIYIKSTTFHYQYKKNFLIIPFLKNK